MTDYSIAFKLPFSNLKRTGILFLLAFAPSMLWSIYKLLFGGLSAEADPYSALGAAIGWILVAAIITLIFYSIATGYSLKIASSAIDGHNRLPAFDNLLGMLGRGAQNLIAAIIYALPFVALLAIAFVLMLKSIISATMGAPSAGSVLAGIAIGLPVMAVMIFFFAYIMPMLSAHFAHEKKFAALFSLGKVFKYAFTTAYFVPWLVAFGYSILLLIIYLIFSVPLSLLSANYAALGLVEPFISGAYSTILAATTMSLYGQAYREAAGMPAAHHTAAQQTAKKARAAKK